MKTLIAALLVGHALLASPALAAEKTEVTFKSGDGLEITADLYVGHEDPKTPFIVLFHQARWSRGEYLEIAPRLNELGFNCLAVDQRSGDAVNDVENLTVKRAEEQELGTTYVDALPDLIASLKFVREKHAKGKVLAWGSSYSSALVLKVAGDHPELVDGALAFAPGEYFEKLGKPADWIRTSAKKIKQPVFVTSARSEKPNWTPIFEVIPSKAKVSYLPETAGNHGSRALWKKFEDSSGYWKALEPFLKKNFLKVKVVAPGKDG